MATLSKIKIWFVIPGSRSELLASLKTIKKKIFVHTRWQARCVLIIFTDGLFTGEEPFELANEMRAMGVEVKFPKYSRNTQTITCCILIIYRLIKRCITGRKIIFLGSTYPASFQLSSKFLQQTKSKIKSPFL